MGLFRSFDLSNNIFTFTMDEHVNFKTKFGAFLSILIGILTILATVSFGIEIAFKNNPKIYTSFTDTESSEISNQINEIEMFAISVYRENGEKIQNLDKKFQFTINNNSNTFSDMNSNFISLIPCNNSSDSIISEIVDKYQKDINDYFCLPMNYKFIIKNDNDEIINQKLTMSKCVKTNQNTCGNIAESDKDENINIHFIYSNTYVDSLDKLNPFILRSIDRIIKISNNSKRIETLNYQKLKFNSDNGNVLHLNELYYGFHLLNSYSDIINLNNNDNSIFIVNFRVEKQILTFFRNYKKLQVLAAEVGGAMKFLTTFLFTLMEKYSEFKFTKSLIQKSSNKTKIEKNDLKFKDLNSSFNVINNNRDNLFKNKEIVNKNDVIIKSKTIFNENNNLMKLKTIQKKTNNFDFFSKNGINNLVETKDPNRNLILKDNKMFAFNKENRVEHNDNNHEDEIIFDTDIENKTVLDETKINEIITKYNEVKQKQKIVEIFQSMDEYSIKNLNKTLDDSSDALTILRNFVPFTGTAHNQKVISEFKKFLNKSFSVENFLRLKIEHNCMISYILGKNSQDEIDFKSKSEFLYSLLTKS